MVWDHSPTRAVKKGLRLADKEITGKNCSCPTQECMFSGQFIAESFRSRQCIR